MPIYTKTGDNGTTAVFGGRRVSKDAEVVAAYGNLDELDSFIGLTISHVKDKKVVKLLTTVQRDLYQIMGILAGSTIDTIKIVRIKKNIKSFEKTIDEITKSLPELHHFILVQGDHAASHLHVCRAICRRAERSVVGFLKEDIELKNEYRDLMVQYLNRLSDLLFTLARKYNEGKDILA